ncbi:class I SAM-dependent methyltransferase [Gracilimonas sp. Q87]|uniref:class I SAM-dependent methyltransferase n=1 Tax=Gracilimonas sp. Q87 TaxID=3384766 RepID=UPI0039844392
MKNESIQQSKRISKDQIKQVADKVVQHLAQQRQLRENQIPKVSLQPEHIENCELLLNRHQLLGKMKKNSIVAEIGVDEGKFSQLIHKKVKPQKFHLIDMWGSDRFHDGKFEAVKDYFAEEIKEETVRIHKIMSTKAAHEFKEEYFDWIYIDTDHSYETTRDELQLFAPKVKPGGIMAGHDYRLGNWVSMYRYGVIEAVHEFCVNYNWELVYLTVEPTESQSFAIRKIQEE